jgi:8-hydroxy-5-deazaflavin:NADPH oxidoreductase
MSPSPTPVAPRLYPPALARETGAEAVTVEQAARSDEVVIVSMIDPIERGVTESRWVSNQLGRAVVKGFKNIYTSHLVGLGKPKGAAGRIALPVAGDDRRAKNVIIRLLDELGFDGVDAGGLDESWRQQPGTPVYGTDFDAAGVRDGLAKASPERGEAFRAGGGSPAHIGRR